MEGETQNETPRYDGPRAITLQAKILCAKRYASITKDPFEINVQEGGQGVGWRARMPGRGQGGTENILQTWVWE